jgi:hypothetical protein
MKQHSTGLQNCFEPTHHRDAAPHLLLLPKMAQAKTMCNQVNEQGILYTEMIR